MMPTSQFSLLTMASYFINAQQRPPFPFRDVALYLDGPTSSVLLSRVDVATSQFGLGAPRKFQAFHQGPQRN